jgi:hypothetical protein
VDAGDHQTELLKSSEILLFRPIVNQEAVHGTEAGN